MLSPDLPAIALIGAGPRGTSLLERLGANLRDPAFAAGAALAGGVEIHVIDDAQTGAGKIWRTDQTRELCMNTLADAVTLFTEPAGTQAGPVAPGPTLYEWCLLALQAEFPSAAVADRLRDVAAEHIAVFESVPVRPGIAAAYREELEALRPESHPSRALYGEYLAWCYAHALATLPPQARVVRHTARAVKIDRVDGREVVHLNDGSTVTADAVVVGTGWLPRAQTAGERDLEEHLAGRPDLTWVRPESPVEQDLRDIAPGSHAIVRGLGMGFFDTMALLTLGRGGVFEADPGDPTRLRYLASGREPVLHVTSRRGVPFRAKTLYGSLPPRAEQRYLRAVDWDAVPRPIDFDHLLWPRIVADGAVDHYTTLHRVRPAAFAAPLADVLAAIEGTLDELLDPATRLGIERSADAGDEQFSDRAGAQAWLTAVPQRIDDTVATLVPDPADRFDLVSEMDPAGRSFPTPAAFDAWVRKRVDDDLREAELGRDSARKAGLWSIASARGFASRLGTFGGFDAESRGAGLATLFAVGGMAGSGPPAFRNRQLLALVDAGLVHFIGPAARVEVRPEGFVARSALVSGSEVTAPALIDAWMHFHDIAETADPLTASLIAAGRARPFAVTARSGAPLATGGFDIDPATGLLIGADGSVDAAVHVAGIPVDATVHDTIISPMPGTDPTMLRETDRVARSALHIAERAHCSERTPS